MASIYANAYLTLAATGSRAGVEGLKRFRDDTLVINITEIDGTRSKLLARRRIDHDNFGWPFPGMEGLRWKPYLPLSQRGWAFQERLLSPRMIHYNPSEVIWECLGMTSCECGALESARSPQNFYERQFMAGVSEDVELRCGKLERGKAVARWIGILREEGLGTDFVSYLHPVLTNDYVARVAAFGPELAEKREGEWGERRWRDLVSQYSCTTLRFDSDRLQAVAGLASVFHSRKAVPCSYLAGLWDDDLLFSLLWECIDNTKKRSDQYVAPTWSWASVRSEVALDRWGSWRFIKYHVTILDANCTVKDSRNPFGEVSAGSVTLKGPCMRAKFATFVSDSKTWFWSRVPCKGFKLGDIPNSDNMGFGKDTDNKDRYVEHYIKVDSVPEAIGLKDSEILVVWFRTDVTNQQTGDGHDRGLVLRACDDDLGTFRRVGVIEYMNKKFDEEVLCQYEEMTVTIV